MSEKEKDSPQDTRMVPMPAPTLNDIERELGGEEEKVEVGQDASDHHEKREESKTLAVTNAKKTVERIAVDSPLPPASTARAQSSSSPTANNNTATWMKCAVLLIIIILLGILAMTAVIFIELKDDDNVNSTDRNIDGGDNNPTTENPLPTARPSTNSPTPGNNDPTSLPSQEPFDETLTPTFRPTPGIDDNECPTPVFRSIANQSGAVLLDGLQECPLDIVSCEARVVLPFEFPNYNSLFMSPTQPYRSIFVSPDATIRFFKNGFANPFCASDCGGIGVAQSRIPYASYSGEIWTLATASEKFVVSWENVSWNQNCCDDLINAQATLYANGNVEICWGSGSIADAFIFSGIWDLSQGYSDIDFPMRGDPFWETGQAEIWPSNQCRTFDFFSGRLEWTFPEQECSRVTYSCESSQRIQLPFDSESENLSSGVLPLPLATNPAVACPRFDEDSDQKVQWYEFVANAMNSCVCVELRSFSIPAIVGVYYKNQTSTTTSTYCDSLSCIQNSDFTSESILWRTVPGQTYKIAVSLLPFGEENGPYQLRVIESPCTGETEPNGGLLLAGSCS